MSTDEGLYSKILKTPEYMGVLSAAGASLFQFSQAGLLVGFCIAAVLYTFKTKKTMNIKELFLCSGAYGGFSLIISLLTWFFMQSRINVNFRAQIIEIVIWTIGQILEGIFIFFVLGLIVSSIIVLFSRNKQISRFINFIDYMVNSPLITIIFILGVIYLAKLYF